MGGEGSRIGRRKERKDEGGGMLLCTENGSSQSRKEWEGRDKEERVTNIFYLFMSCRN